MTLQAHRDAMKVRPGYWFARKLYGYGATPVTWQGWLSALVYLGIVGLAAWLAPTTFLKVGTIVPITTVYLYFVWTRTDGGFGWRWGPEKK
ncbi:hypothetical protein [Sphingomonas sp. LT1P40]|uniref:hypothetical protein n=1 Tax=Alteristakelama amylovorans TaxID=3096166 RepID=UPI002FC8E23A